MTNDDQTRERTNQLIYKMQPSLVRTKDGTCTNADNTPYAGFHTGYNGQCPAVVLPTHPEPQRKTFPADSDNTDSYYRISHASAKHVTSALELNLCSGKRPQCNVQSV